MKNSLVSTLLSAAAFLVLALCAAPLVAQDAAQPDTPAATTADTPESDHHDRRHEGCRLTWRSHRAAEPGDGRGAA